jgi:hypothetical protein
MKKVFTAILSSAALFALTPAHAQPNYPGVVQDYLHAVRKPPCKVCHIDGVTGFGTAGTPFAQNMKTYLMRAYDEESVRVALHSMELYEKDSSNERRKPIDVDVLRRGGDPNDPNPVYIIDDPQYGCGGATMAGNVRTSLPGALFVGGLALLALRRRRR